ncbi:MAG: hypothetical protein A3A81_08790 [Omnitrophica bacterium RIFCSPLOWO2_01_FULL_45_10b]|nr:MAG: hypothetical protein A3A81_08790 [Omnitrophica bacterium RIFCSPLOWO2_01_FULL_45_10b]
MPGGQDGQTFLRQQALRLRASKQKSTVTKSKFFFIKILLFVKRLFNPKTGKDDSLPAPEITPG